MTAKRLMSTLAAAGAMTAIAIAPGAAIGGNGKGKGPKADKVAKRACQAERAEDRAAFKEAYGKNAMRNCKREARGEVRNASKECRAERDELGKDAFNEQYGTNKNKRNAFGKCVSSKVRDSVDPEPDDEEETEEEETETGTS